MGLLKTITALLAVLSAIWWAIAERKYLDLVDSASLQTNKDPAYTVDVQVLENAISCPVDVQNAKETILLVHGTGMTPEKNWDYTLTPSLVNASFKPCYIAIPNRLLDDIQISAEYISFAINALAKSKSESESASNQISVIAWSAGALTTQWTMTFYPETRSKVKRFIAIGADFHGSWVMAPLVLFNLYTQAIVQQVPSSNLMKALTRFGGGVAKVPTTAIGSSTDLIVQPSFYGEGWSWAGLRDSWRLSGDLASNVDVFKICAKMEIQRGRIPHVVGHDSLLWEGASHRVIFDALKNDRSFLGTADGVTVEDCMGGLAEGIPAGSEDRLKEIMPELSDYASKRPVDGWPEVPLFQYAEVQ